MFALEVLEEPLVSLELHFTPAAAGRLAEVTRRWVEGSFLEATPADPSHLSNRVLI